MKVSFKIIFIIVLLAVTYLVFFYKTKPIVNFRGPSNAPAIQGPTEPPPLR